jgi:hypothetical protein
MLYLSEDGGATKEKYEGEWQEGEIVTGREGGREGGREEGEI